MTGFYATGEVATGSVIDASTTPPAGDNENPILSAPTVTGTSSGAVTGSINTNEGTGTLFFVAAGAMPTATAIKARGSQLVISAGAQTVSISNLAAGTYQLYFLHRDAAGNDSDIATTGSFDVVVLPPLGQVVTDAEFAAWWETDDAIVNILFEVWPLVDHVPTLLRWSTLGYMSPGTANPIFYEPGMSFDVMPTESLPLDGGASISAGNLEIENLDRSREYLKRYVWKNRPFIARVGDLRWGPADYRIIRVGQTDSLVPKDDHTLALHLRDMTERLNAPLSEHKLGGDGPNQDALYPLAFGE
ncbi:MAG: hypothetical protein M3Y65_11760, partial [Pseudomonadota bacterium]|nr:hypothetical protein [Pseudomonadota bacterium]